jgi:hypothetical protein
MDRRKGGKPILGLVFRKRKCDGSVMADEDEKAGESSLFFFIVKIG